MNTDTAPRRMSVPSAIEWLRSRHGGEKARRLARLELQKARRARSRKRFAYWTAVLAELEPPRAAPAAPVATPAGAEEALALASADRARTPEHA